ncbi:N-acetyltransferase [Sulfoacidibacillus thermotolerans]|uniref:N-acetyltransferase n=1 Tax=Sulfoacidibacillus thermotolerans TaxID=1765684 RepID=UPI0026945566
MIRTATVEDVEQIALLLRHYADQGLLLPRSRQSICENLLSFYVIEEAGHVYGTGALHVLGDDLAEIRSLAIAQNAQGKGYGRVLVDTLFQRAQELKIPRVLALTYQEAFFSRCGFQVVEKQNLHQKIWKDCINCKKFPACDEIAMIRETGYKPVLTPWIESPLYNVQS